jgi:hypothetical protein
MPLLAPITSATVSSREFAMCSSHRRRRAVSTGGKIVP